MPVEHCGNAWQPSACRIELGWCRAGVLACGHWQVNKASKSRDDHSSNGAGGATATAQPAAAPASSAAETPAAAPPQESSCLYVLLLLIFALGCLLSVPAVVLSGVSIDVYHKSGIWVFAKGCSDRRLPPHPDWHIGGFATSLGAVCYPTSDEFPSYDMDCTDRESCPSPLVSSALVSSPLLLSACREDLAFFVLVVCAVLSDVSCHRAVLALAVEDVFCESGDHCISSLKDLKFKKFADLGFACVVCALVLNALSCLVHAIAGCASIGSKEKPWAIHAVACCFGILGGEAVAAVCCCACSRTTAILWSRRRILCERRQRW